MFEHLQRLQELIDKNCQNIPEGDYLALCDTTKKIYAHEEDATLAVWSVCMRQAEHDMQTSSCHRGSTLRITRNTKPDCENMR